MLLQRTPDSGWEMLALLDQYYRRGKISAETFTSLKAHLQNILMSKAGGELNPQIPTVRDELVKTPGNTSTVVPLPTMPTMPTMVTTPVRAAVEPIMPRPDRAPAEGDVLRGRYRIQKLLGQGGLGSVFEAIDLYRVDEPTGEQRVAIKVLHSAVLKRPRLFAELRREFQHVQSLSHPNIVRVHEFDRDGDLAFFTMEYLSGALLSRLMSAENPQGMDRRCALAIIRDVGAAIAHAHSRGLVHGDLNPGNIFITDTGEVRVLGFGAASQMRRGPWISELDEAQPTAVATPTFASCELLEGETADARDDVYALACVAYLLFTGSHPFHEITALKARSLRVTPKRPRGLTRRQWHALKAGLQFDRAKRPAELQAWLAALDVSAAVPHLPMLTSLWTRRTERRASGKWIVAGLAATVVAAGAWWTAEHVDSVVREGTNLGARLTSFFTRDDAGAAAPPQLSVHAAPASAAPATAAPPVPPVPAAPANAATAIAVNPPASSPAVRITGAGSNSVPVAAAAAQRTASAAAASSAITPAAAGARARIELDADNIQVTPGETTALVVVRRTRSLRGDTTFSWWTESGTAKPGQDFVAVKPHVETIENGKSSITMLIPIVMDPERHQERNFYIVIDEPSDNAALGPRTLTMVTIPGSE